MDFHFGWFGAFGLATRGARAHTRSPSKGPRLVNQVPASPSKKSSQLLLLCMQARVVKYLAFTSRNNRRTPYHCCCSLTPKDSMLNHRMNYIVTIYCVFLLFYSSACSGLEPPAATAISCFFWRSKGFRGFGGSSSMMACTDSIPDEHFNREQE